MTHIAIDDLVVLVDNSSVPFGYEKIDHDLNEGAGGRYLYFAFHRSDHNHITAPVHMIYSDDSGVAAPEGFTKIDIDLNMGSGGKFIYACIKRGEGTPITGLDVISGDSSDIQPPPPWIRVDLDLNLSVGGKYIYLTYRTDPDLHF